MSFCLKYYISSVFFIIHGTRWSKFCAFASDISFSRQVLWYRFNHRLCAELIIFLSINFEHIGTYVKLSNWNIWIYFKIGRFFTKLPRKIFLRLNTSDQLFLLDTCFRFLYRIRHLRNNLAQLLRKLFLEFRLKLNFTINLKNVNGSPPGWRELKTSLGPFALATISN